MNNLKRLGQAVFLLELDCNSVITGSNPVGTSKER